MAWVIHRGEGSRGGSKNFERGGGTLQISLLKGGGTPFKFWCLLKGYFKKQIKILPKRGAQAPPVTSSRSASGKGGREEGLSVSPVRKTKQSTVFIMP